MISDRNDVKDRGQPVFIVGGVILRHLRIRHLSQCLIVQRAKSKEYCRYWYILFSGNIRMRASYIGSALKQEN